MKFQISLSVTWNDASTQLKYIEKFGILVRQFNAEMLHDIYLM